MQAGNGQEAQAVQPGSISKAAGEKVNQALDASLSDLTQDQEVCPPPVPASCPKPCIFMFSAAHP